MRAYGYTNDNQLIDGEADIIREIAGRAVVGEPFRSICRNLNERGIKTAGGVAWDSSTLRTLLRNPRLIGQAPKGVTRVPAILSDEMFAKVQDRLDQGDRKIHKGRGESAYLLSGGWLICGKCGKKMVPKGGVPPAYVCSERPPMKGCGRMRISVEAVETAVAARVLAYIADPQIRAAIVAAAEAFHGGPARIESLAGQVGQAIEDDDPDKIELLRDQLSMAVAEWEPIARWSAWFTDETNLTPKSLAEWWESASILRRQDLLLCLIDHVEVKSVGRIGRYTDDTIRDRLTFVWRQI